MNIAAELIDNAKTMLHYRQSGHKRQAELDRQAPKVGDMAPDFTLFDVNGANPATLSDFRGQKPVALVFGSYT